MRREIEPEEVEQFFSNQQRIMLQLDDLQSQMKDVLIELGGAPDSNYRDPDRRPIRRRLHDLEGRQTTEDLVTEALKTARQRTWGRSHIIVLVCFGAIGALGGLSSMLRMFGVGG